MRVRVVFLGSLRAVAGRKELEMDLLEGSKVSVLISEVSKLTPSIAELMADPTQGNLIIIGGVEIGNLQGVETPLVEGSEVVLVPVTHGGS